MWGRVAHSLYFTLIPEMGIVGILLFSGILWGNYRDYCLIRSLEKKKDNLLDSALVTDDDTKRISQAIRTCYFFSLAYNGAMIAFLITGIFLSVLWYNYFWTLTSFYVATGNFAQELKNKLMLVQTSSVPEYSGSRSN